MEKISNSFFFKIHGEGEDMLAGGDREEGTAPSGRDP
jgi:hypothetical protein